MSQALFDNIVQIGVVVENADATISNYRQLLDLHDWHINYVDTESGKGSNFYKENIPITAKAKIAWINIGNVELEIIEPLDQDSVYTQFLQENGPGHCRPLRQNTNCCLW